MSKSVLKATSNSVPKTRSKTPPKSASKKIAKQPTNNPQEDWQACLAIIKEEISPQEFDTCIRPLQAVPGREAGNCVKLLAPNWYVKDQIDTQYLPRIRELLAAGGNTDVRLMIGAREQPPGPSLSSPPSPQPATGPSPFIDINKEYTFDTFVEGNSNQLALAAARGLVENLGTQRTDHGASQYNPILFYGGVGLGKTHLMHAVGNAIEEQHPQLKVGYMYSHKFIVDMVNAIQKGTMPAFVECYRGIDVLLMDDIQFLARGAKTQEEFFAVFNRLLDKRNSQIVLTSDRYPRGIKDLEERLKSRFLWGMSAHLEAPDVETRVAILMKKAESKAVPLPRDVGFFIARLVKSNVRELEGALKRVVADAHFRGVPITMEQTKAALRDLIAHQSRQVSIENIKKLVTEYYRIRISDLHSKRRNRSITRPRQLAMALAKELTNQSLPEIGDAFGGRDHSTVLHACKKIEELRESNGEMAQDYDQLLKQLTT